MPINFIGYAIFTRISRTICICMHHFHNSIQFLWVLSSIVCFDRRPYCFWITGSKICIFSFIGFVFWSINPIIISIISLYPDLLNAKEYEYLVYRLLRKCFDSLISISSLKIIIYVSFEVQLQLNIQSLSSSAFSVWSSKSDDYYKKAQLSA